MGPFHMIKSLLVLSATTMGVQGLIEPTEIYNGGFNGSDTPTLLRIATGGAGQSGLVKGTQSTTLTRLSDLRISSLIRVLVLADAFIQESVRNGSKPFSIGWVCVLIYMHCCSLQ
jgi:hypothetical protein